MVITPHALAGAFAAGRSTSLAAGMAAAIQSHLALDRIPHTDYSLRGPAGILRATLDAALAVALLRWCGATSTRQLLGALAGVAPDALAVGYRRGLLPSAVPGVEQLVATHDDNHTERDPDPWLGWLAQLAVGVGAALLLRRLNRR